MKKQKKYCQITLLQISQAGLNRAKAGFKLYNFNLCKSKGIKSLFEILASYDSVI